MPLFSNLRLGKSKATREKTGLWPLSTKASEESDCVDVFAIHGLGGDAFGTWTDGNGQLWLRDSLPSLIPQARVHTYGYDSVVAFSKSSAEVDDFARDLLNRIKGVRISVEEKSRPIFFICHSLGGLVFKQALNFAHEDSIAYSELLHYFRGVAFMGTPHGGSDVALWASLAANFLHSASYGSRTNKDLLQLLRRDSKYLGSLSKQFLMQNQSLRILSFYETEKFPLLNCRIVEKDSAHLKLPNETLLPIFANHRTMCRFSDTESQKFHAIKGPILRMIHNREGVAEFPVNSLSQYHSALNEWLHPVPAIDDFERIKARRLEGSCQWIETNSIFQNWTNYDRLRVLWIVAPPGFGKSTLATHIIEFLSSKGPTAYFFCDFRNSDRGNWASILRTWIWQLLQRKSHLVGGLFDIYAETLGAVTPIVSFQRALNYLTKSGAECFLVLDGLDEYREADLQAARDAFITITRHAKLAVLSRREEWVRSILPTSLGTFATVHVNSDHNSGDIEDWITSRTNVLSVDGPVRQQVAHQLATRSKGMFLWAQLMVDNIFQQTTPAEIQSALENLPDGLEDVYWRLVQRIDSLPPNRFKLAQKVLRWTFSAIRPLSIRELGAALATEAGSFVYNPENEVLNLKDAVLDACGPLLDYDEVNDTLRFVHVSAMEFFESAGKGSLEQSESWLPLSSIKTYVYTGAVCLTYLSFDDIGFVSEDSDGSEYDENLRKHLDSYPLLAYCALYWWMHLAPMEAESQHISDILSESARRFLSSQFVLVKWLQLFHLLDGFHKPKYATDQSFEPSDNQYSWMLSAPGSYFSHLLTAPSGLFDRWDRWTTETSFNGRRTTSLGIASFFDFVHVVKSDIDRGVGLEATDHLGFTPLLRAAHGEAIETTRFLLSKEADVTAITHAGYTAIEYAARNGIGVLQLLLESGASVFSSGGSNSLSALYVACSSTGWHPLILRYILENCNDEQLDSVNLTGKTPLHIAASIDVQQTTELLFQRLALVSRWKSRSSRLISLSAEETFTPTSRTNIINWAYAWGLQSPESKLIESSPNQVRENLLILIQKIKANIVETLCQRSQSFRSADVFGRTPLHLAAEMGVGVDPSRSVEPSTDPTARILLRLGNAVDARDANGQTPFDLALNKAHWITVKTLLQGDGIVGMLGVAEKRRIELMIEGKGDSQSIDLDTTNADSNLNQRSELPHSKTSFDALCVFFVLQQCFSARPKRRSPENGDFAHLIRMILDYAEYWVTLTAASGTETMAGLKNRRERSAWGRGPSVATLKVQKGQVRKIEISISRHLREVRGESKQIHGDAYPEWNYSDWSPFCTYHGSMLAYRRHGSELYHHQRTSTKRGGAPFSEGSDDAYFQLVRRPRDSKDEFIDIARKGGPLVQQVPSDPTTWEKAYSDDLTRSSYPHWDTTGTWKQVLPPLAPSHASRRIKDWMNGIVAGDEISLVPSDAFFIRDVALYDRFELSCSSSWW